MVNYLKNQLAFSYKPNTMRLCGIKDEGIYDLVKKEKWDKKDKKRVLHFIKNLKGVYAYASAIADKLGVSPYSREALGAYHIGGINWDGVAKKLKENLRQIAIDKKIDEIRSMPKNIPFTHNFHTLYFGAIAIELPMQLNFADKCKVSLGKIEGNKIVYNKLEPQLNVIEALTEFESPLFEVSDGQRVFLHHGVVFRIAEKDAIKAYKKDFKKVLEVTKHLW